MRPTLYGYAQFVFGEWQMCTSMYTSIDDLNKATLGPTDGLKLVEVKPGDAEYDELYKAFGVMKIAVLNYSTGDVNIFEVPEGENIEWYLTEEKGYRMDDIHWMEAKCININIGV